MQGGSIKTLENCHSRTIFLADTAWASVRRRWDRTATGALYVSYLYSSADGGAGSLVPYGVVGISQRQAPLQLGRRRWAHWYRTASLGSHSGRRLCSSADVKRKWGIESLKMLGEGGGREGEEKKEGGKRERGLTARILPGRSSEV